MVFNYKGIDCGLTYPEAKETTKLGLESFIASWTKNSVEVTKYCICEEIGEKSGRRHYHAYVRFNQQTRLKEDDFDWEGIHCHIKKVKKLNKTNISPMIIYLTKADKFPASNFDWKACLEDKKVDRYPPWEEYLEKKYTREQVVNRLLEDGYATEYANHYTQWSGFIKATFKEEPKTPYIHDDTLVFNLPESLAMWMNFYFRGWDGYSRPKSLILVGGSRTGKTTWARSLGHHMYFNSMLNLDDWDESAEYIILDDFSTDFTKFLPTWKCFFGGQKEFTLTDKYRGKRTVHWGKPMIWLANEDPLKTLNVEQLDFINKNCVLVTLVNKLY